MAGAVDPQSHTPQASTLAAGDRPTFVGVVAPGSAGTVEIGLDFEGAEALVGAAPSTYADAVANLAEAQYVLAAALAAIPLGLLSDAEAVSALGSVEAIGRTVDADGAH